ncbi:MAG TPA: low molecular weight protein-tyrosine-phosphatase [Egibacteraceae bacterium]|nr:low molecular weight protein-tyrosine-phosphatase [Egibacteraceae bacterium]
MRILVVCLGNICRSPLAEVALRQEIAAAGMTDDVSVDSAGTGDWNVGKPPNDRMRRAAAAVGLALEGTARQIAQDDLAHSDLILVMDEANLRDVRALAPDDATRAKVHLFLDYAGQGPLEVPDPYYGEDEGFDEVVAVVRPAARAIVERLAASTAA